MKIPFNRPPITLKGIEYIRTALGHERLSGEGYFNETCQTWFKSYFKCEAAFLTPSCTSALEMGMMLMGIKPGDEVILPSFTFTSTATAIVLFGGVPVFIDSDPHTMNMDVTLIEKAITLKTKAILPVHYAGVSCDMDNIMAIADKYKLWVMADAAQCMGSFYDGKPLGSFGHLSAFSFHDTKNIVCGEGGALIINDPSFVKRAEIIRDKGTNRKSFFRGEVDKYSWVDLGSSYLLSEFSAAYLLSQLESLEEITYNRIQIWNYYQEELEEFEDKGLLRRPVIPDYTQHNAHIYYMIFPTEKASDDLKSFLNCKGVMASTHYVPLHSSDAGRKFGRFLEPITVVNRQANCLLRLPLYYGMTAKEYSYVIQMVKEFYARYI